MKRVLPIILLLLLCNQSAPAQIRMLPAEKRDSLIKAQAARKAYSSPDMQFDSLAANMGRVMEKTKVKAVYPFKVLSKASIEMGEVRTSCSCVTAVIRPNLVEVVYDTNGHPGRHPRYIEIYNKKDRTLLARLVLDCIVEEE